MDINMSNMELLVESNRGMFSTDKLDLYPRNYEDLKQFLLVHSLEDDKCDTLVDTGVSYLPRQKTMGKAAMMDIDIEKKLFLEYAKYKANGSPQDRFLKLLLEPKEKELLLGMAGVLREQVDTYEQVFKDKSLLWDRQSRQQLQEGQHLEEVASYLISSMIQKGIEIQSQGDSTETLDTRDMCKLCIDSLLEQCQTVVAQGPSIENSSESDVKAEKSRHSNAGELKTAFQDLQLAHKFLTEKFEDDRKQYLQQIEQLERTNRELQQELLNYHSQLSKAREQINKLESATPPTSVSTEHNTPIQDIFSKSPPSMGSTSSISSPASMSFVIMKQEFKKLLSETQNKYERELKDERDLRKKLEAQLSSRF
ncbi:Pea2p Ecym_5548 [Eremothecium cymbalariae DBVPG|uniref:Uncharacterized protein n=1 Tax=Eremothecium cymbalariae (strain CBS 270.75 / DBVPG 7215 / KCTC 17166 / NRRL Y-17582) TaxID=931890 RepID=I6NDZ6_ERECY|nr:hypothetical protein Ecym_5548 [Eremothecium cymbalariae DBVPG\